MKSLSRPEGREGSKQGKKTESGQLRERIRRDLYSKDPALNKKGPPIRMYRAIASEEG